MSRSGPGEETIDRADEQLRLWRERRAALDEAVEHEQAADKARRRAMAAEQRLVDLARRHP